MFQSLFGLGLILGSLLVLVPKPTTGFTVKLLSNSNTFGERQVVDSLEKKSKVPIGHDAYPDPNGKSHNRENVPSSDELYLENLSVAKPMTNDEIDAYLMRFGYLVAPVNGTVSEKDREAAIREFQRFSRISETGVMDPRTRRQARIARCGLVDPVSNNKFANFDAKGTRKWSKKDLTYKIASYTEKLSKENIREWTKKAFKMWSDASQLTFKEVSENDDADLRLTFTPKKHGDGFPFDGIGGTLAHAFYPQSGEIHLEEAENWTIESKNGINLLFVLVHEIGHALGLGHSGVNNAIMEPFYNGYIPNLKLDADDIAGIQFLYGKPEAKPPTEAPATKAPATQAPATQAPATKAPTTHAPTTKAPATQAPTTHAPATKAPATQAPATQAPATKAPTTHAPTTKAPYTTHPATKAPNTTHPATKAPNTTHPATKAPYTTHPATKAPNTTHPATKAPYTTHPASKAPHTTHLATKATYPTTNAPFTTESPYYTTSEPTAPPRNFPCPFRFWSTMSVGNQTFGFFRRWIYEIYPSGRYSRVGSIRSVFSRGPRVAGAAAHNDVTGHTFLFWGRWVWRYTDHKLDRGFPRRIKNFIRAAVVVDAQLIAFSFTHIHYFDEDTMEDYVDGEVTIADEYPGLPFGIRSVISGPEGSAYVFYTRKHYKVDMYTGEMSEEKSCKRRYN